MVHIRGIHMIRMTIFACLMGVVSIHGMQSPRRVRWATEFHEAAAAGRLEVITQLGLNSSENINSVDAQGNTPLIIAAQNGHYSVVKFLIDMAAEINVQNSQGTTALIAACSALDNKEDRLQIIELLLRNNADKALALHAAVKCNFSEAVELLIQDTTSGDLQVMDNDGKTPKDYARPGSTLDILQALS